MICSFLAISSAVTPASAGAANDEVVAEPAPDAEGEAVSLPVASSASPEEATPVSEEAICIGCEESPVSDLDGDAGLKRKRGNE